MQGLARHLANAICGVVRAINNGVAQLGLEHVGSNGMPATLSAWLALPLPPSAILCGSDALAAATLRQCELKGVAVPHDLSVVGFGDTELARVVRPSLSSLRIPAY